MPKRRVDASIPQPLPSIAGPLIRWYQAVRRDLPWRRRSSDGYAQLLAEFMLQQTQVATVVPYYERFMARFPTVADLAAAEVDEVLTLWSGLGYYSRARNLHLAARQVVERFRGKVPADVVSLMSLPGVGRYTAGAISSIAYGTRSPVLDGNVVRVFMRLLALDEDPKSPALRERLWSVAERLLPADACGDFNQGLMELGATVCRPKGPDCQACPIRRHCRARALGAVDRIPPAARRTRVKSAVYAVAAVRCGRRMLFVQRPMGGLWAGLWELPSEVADSAGAIAAARLRLRGRLPAGTRLGSECCARTISQLTHRRVTFHVFAGTAGGQVEPVAGAGGPAGRWLAADELGAVGLSRATRSILEAIGWS
jgi:A/G-specific adenine glycosylase